MSQLRLAGVNGYAVLLGADAYTAFAETSDHGYPVLAHAQRLITSELIWLLDRAAGHFVDAEVADERVAGRLPSINASASPCNSLSSSPSQKLAGKRSASLRSHL